jgi:hypothetical protein
MQRPDVEMVSEKRREVMPQLITIGLNMTLTGVFAYVRTADMPASLQAAAWASSLVYDLGTC